AQAINGQVLTQQLVPESQIIAGLDYLALSEATAERYLALGSDPNLLYLPIPAEQKLIRSPKNLGVPEATTRPERLWVWGLEFHGGTSGPEPYLVAAGPMYYESIEPDEVGVWKLAGYIAGGRRIDARLLGTPAAAGEMSTELILADTTGAPVWSSFQDPSLAYRYLQDMARREPLGHRPHVERLDDQGRTLLVSTFNLNALPNQSVEWLEDTYLILLQPEGQFTQQLAQIRKVLLLAAAGSALLALALALVVTAGLSRPLQQLAQAAGQFARGEPVPYVVPETRDEVQTLAQAFHSMVEDRQRATARLVQAEKLAAWRDVARKLAHEIKNPLQPIRLQVESLVRIAERRPEKLQEMLPEAAEIVLFEVDRLKHLADEFSDFARMPQPILEPTALEPLLQRVVLLAAGAHPEIPIEVEVPPSMPLLALDPEKITQAVLNLVKNAVEALAEERTPEPLVTVAADLPPEGGATIAVVDNGPGLAEEIRDRLFTPYLTTKEGGTGLGLVVVQQVITEHGGTVAVEPTPGGGTTFILRFPPTLVVAAQG
ncbi:MAG TPA: ATP-binding protein, partial [bacterium]|nr:ATP-binding protein [bacterium]